MATERIVIEVQTRGTRRVKRNLENIGKSAKRSATLLQQMRNTLVVVAAVRVLRGFTDLADSFVNLENRLRATLGSLTEAREAQSALLQIALDTRTGIDATGDAFARLALGAKDLGLSTETLLGVTRTLNQAIILSGASTQEARNAMIQFSQGIASGALRGDELRAVLEQLPLLSRIIADEFDVNIGQLRKLGETGALTTDRLIQALEKAGPRLEAAFGNTIVTIDQAFSNLTTNFTVFIDSFAKASGAAQGLVGVILGLGNAFRFLSDNIATVSGVLAALATIALTLVIRKMFLAVAATTAFKVAMLGAEIVGGGLAGKMFALSVAIKSVTVAILSNPMFIFAAVIAGVVGAIVGLNVATEDLNEALDTQSKALREQRQELDLGLIITERATAARISDTRSIEDSVRARNEEAQSALLARDALGELSAVSGGDSGVEKTAAQASDNVKELTSQLTELQGIADGLNFDLGPEDFIAPARSKKIISTLKDLNFEIAQLGRQDDRTRAIGTALKAAGLEFESFEDGADDIRDAAGALFDMEEAADKLKDTQKALAKENDKLKKAAQELFNESLPLSERAKIVEAELAKLKQFLVKLTIDEAQANRILADEKERLVRAIEEEIAPEALEFLEDRKTLTDKIADAEKDSIEIKRQLIKKDIEEGEATKLSNEFLRDKIKLLKEEAAAEGVGIVDRFFTASKGAKDLVEAEKNLKEAQEAGGISITEQAQSLVLLRREMAGASNAAHEYEQATARLEAGLASGAVKQEEFALLTRQNRIAFLETQRTLEAGSERAFLKFIDDATDAAAQTEKLLVDAFAGMEDALFDFVKNGKLEFDSLFQSIADGLIRIGIQQALGSAFGFAGGQFGATGGGNAGGIGGLVTGLFGAKNGAQFTVGANSAVQSIPGLDNRLIAFRARDGEEVTVTPKSSAGSNPTGPTNIVFNVQARDADSFKRSQSQIQSRALAGINQARRR